MALQGMCALAVQEGDMKRAQRLVEKQRELAALLRKWEKVP